MAKNPAAPETPDAPNADAPAQDAPKTDAPKTDNAPTTTTDAPAAPKIDAPADAPTTTTPEPDALELIIGQTIREGYGLLQAQYDVLLAERKELADEIEARIATGKNGAVLKALESTLADLDAKSLVAKNALGNVEQRVVDAVRYVRQLADPMWVTTPNKATTTTTTPTTTGGQRGPRGVKYAMRAKVSGVEVKSPTAVESISNLCWYKLAKSRVDDVRAAFKAAGVENLETYLANTANAPVTAQVSCPDGVTRAVELSPAAV